MMHGQQNIKFSSGILSRGKVVGARIGEFIAKERKIHRGMFGVQKKAYLNLRTADITFVRPFVKSLRPYRHISGYVKLAGSFHVIRISSLVINLQLRIMQLEHLQTHR
jgi:hypothetical protein